MDEETRSKLNELKSKLDINPFALEDECVNQPSLYAEVGELASEAKSVAKQMREHVEYVKAELSSSIRKDPESHGVGKVTEASVEAAIVLDAEYQRSVAESIDAQRISDSFNVLQSAVEQRKSMLKDLVTLFVYNYYSGRQDMTNESTNIGSVTKDQIIQKRREVAEQRMNRNDEITEVEE